MWYKLRLKTTVPILCFTAAFSIIIYQHFFNSKDLIIPRNLTDPVVIELFTSQGCSNSPAADALISNLKDNPKIIVLSFHVDYWDRLGWRDDFSSQAFSDYQRRYSRKFQVNAYTPEIVVNGTKEFQGTNKRLLNGYLKSHAKLNSLKTPVVTRLDTGFKVDYDLGTLDKSTTAYALLILDDYYKEVTRGQNKGRRLRNSNVVFAKVPLSKDVSKGSYTFKMPPDINAKSKFKIAVIAQDNSLKITGATISKSY